MTHFMTGETYNLLLCFLGVTKAEQLLSTISNMIPQMGPILNQEFSAGKKL